MTVVVAPDRPTSLPRPGIFLSGGISGVGDWQRDAIEHLAEEAQRLRRLAAVSDVA